MPLQRCFWRALGGEADDDMDHLLMPDVVDVVDALPGATYASDSMEVADSLWFEFGGDAAPESAVGAPDLGAENSGACQAGGASSSSSGAPAHPSAHGGAASSSDAPAPAAGASSEGVGSSGGAAPELSCMHGITFDAIEAGGIVRRGDALIGRVTRWSNGKNYGVRCYMHSKCSHAVSSKVPLAECVRWIAEGIKPPAVCSDELRADLKKRHWACKRPSVVPS